jgi:uncharacterized membrane protein YfcA
MEGKLLRGHAFNMTDGMMLAVIVILFLATLVRASLGFGEALISVPLLALIMPVEQAAPIAVLASITIALIILARDWRKVHFRSAGRLTVSTLFGIPAGLLLLKTVPEAGVRALLGVVIMAFSLHSFSGDSRYELKNDRLAWLFGFQAGVLGGAYGMNGPPLAIYGALRRWRPEDFRATLQAYFLPASVAGMSGYWLAGLWTPAVNHFYVASLPAVVLATLLGRVVNSHMDPGRFRSYVYGGLLVTGTALLSQALSGG